jgi:hypothetical protein
MKKSFLDQADEIVKEQNRRLESLSPAQRRVEVAETVQAQAAHAQKNALSIGLTGLLFLGIAAILWIFKYNRSPMSSLGILGGVILGAACFWFIKANTIKSRQKILSNNFTDEDIHAYFREHEMLNERTARWWKKGGIFVSGFVAILPISLVFYSPTTPFGVLMLTVGLGLIFTGLAVILYVQKTANSKT